MGTDQRSRERRLFEAALNGSVENLNVLINEDPVILDRVSTIWFINETPLHIAVLRGHLEFCKKLLSEKPEFRTVVDLQGRLPLHLASVKGYVEIVGELLHSGPDDTCFSRDHDGNIPLHLAVMKGRIEVIQKLIEAPLQDSIKEKLDHGETVFHLAVKHNHLEALKLLVKAEATETDFVNSTDENGNTALHVAAMHQRKEIVKYLLSESRVEVNKNAMNNNGLTALDVLMHRPRDVEGMEILYFLCEAGVRRGANEPIEITTETLADHQQNEIVGLSKIGKWMKYLSTSHGEKWFEDAQQALMVAATLLAGMSFQAAIHPPGDKSANVNSYDFKTFLIFNTGSLIASLSIILLIISGIPLKNKICMWLLILTMCIAIIFIALAYLTGMIIAADGPLSNNTNMYNTYGTALYIWFGIIGMVGLIFLARFLYWLVKKLREFT